MKKIKRREFLKTIGFIGTGAVVLGAECSKSKDNTAFHDFTDDETQAKQNQAEEEKEPAYIGIARGSDPEAITRKAIEAVGGIKRFVKKDDDVIVKPNICTDYYTFEYAATSNPVVVATIVRLALEAGARRVRVMDNTIRGTGSAKKAYKISGIQDAVEAAGGKMEIMNPLKFRKIVIPQGRLIKSWPIYQDILKADVLINVPIPKDHPATEITAGCKNLMGVIGKPGQFHDSQLHQRIADLAAVIRPHLTVVDAVRILMHNGPTGGSLSDVKITNTVIASHDMIAADSYAVTLFHISGHDIEHIRLAGEMGLGLTDLSGVTIKEFVV
jgi:uncharacterized protein (DUF362 family)